MNKQQKNQLPYFRIKNEPEHFISARFLRRKFMPQLRKKFPRHYLITYNRRFYLKFIQAYSKTHPYFLRFDIDKYFLSIQHPILLSAIKSNYSRLTGKPLSRRFKQFLKHKLPPVLKLSPYPNQGLPLGNPLAHILAGIYLLKLDLGLPVPFLRFCDDYLLFGKTKDQPQKVLTQIINPILTELSLSLNIKKSKSGKFHRDSVTFLGFNYYNGCIGISEDKIEEFKQRIKEITYLTLKKPTPAIIKLLNNQILGFGHYYKFAKAKQALDELDSFIRARLRRYINRNKDSRDKRVNLVLTSQILKQLKLKSLTEIYKKYASKKKVKLRKSGKIKGETAQRRVFYMQEISANYRQKQIVTELKELTNLVKKLVKRISKIEEKLD